MTFEEGLVKEFNNSSIKIFPLAAPEGTKPTFVIYKKGKIDFMKSLSGTLNKASGNYALIVVSKNYNELQASTEIIKNLLLSVYSRNIGGEGPFIEDVTVSINGDNYVYDTDEYTSEITLNVKY